MTRHAKKAKRSTETLGDRIKKIELAVGKMESQLTLKESCLESSQRITELERRISARIVELQNEIRERTTAEPNPTNPVVLEEGYVVNLEELEKKMEEQYSLLAARNRELQDLQKRISAELERLVNRAQDNGVLPAARESLLKNRVGVRKRGGRLVSFLVDLGKKN